MRLALRCRYGAEQFTVYVVPDQDAEDSQEDGRERFVLQVCSPRRPPEAPRSCTGTPNPEGPMIRAALQRTPHTRWPYHIGRHRVVVSPARVRPHTSGRWKD